jgi:predicted nucleotidyltransferase
MLQSMKEAIVERLSDALRPVRGLSALVLGGSRARGIARSSSDYDLGLYYETEAPLQVDDIRTAIAPVGRRSDSEYGDCSGWVGAMDQRRSMALNFEPEGRPSISGPRSSSRGYC